MPGNGIGRDYRRGTKSDEAVAIEEGIDLTLTAGLIGGSAYDKTGSPYPEETQQLAKKADAILLGAVGGPQYDALPPSLRPEVGGILALRKDLNLYANLRPIKTYPALACASSLKVDVLDGTDLLIVRELTGGIYFGPKRREDRNGIETAIDEMVYDREEIARIAKIAFKAAEGRNKKLTSVDKANVLETSRLWREVVTEMAADHPDVAVDHLYVDNCAMQLIREPKRFDVILTENTFGDILSDLAGEIAGSLGMLPSASLNGDFGLFEPSHGSAPDIAGKNIANPIAAILSAAMLFRYSLKEEKAAKRIEDAVEKVIEAGWRTADIVYDDQPIGTDEMTEKILSAL